jgi:hypothetical protein
MNVPHYVNENKSDMRGVKSGWYAIADDGHLFIRAVSQPRGMSSAID